MSTNYSDAAFNVLQYDMLQERASSLAHHARRVEAAMAALHTFEGEGEERRELIKKTAHVVWAYFVQREACGFRDHRQVIKDYAIPGAVLVRMGAMEK